MYTRERSVDVLQATGSLLLRIFLCCLALLYLCLDFSSNGKLLCYKRSFSGSLRRPIHSVNCNRYTVTVSSTMAEGGRPSDDIRQHSLLIFSWTGSIQKRLHCFTNIIVPTKDEFEDE